MTISKSGGEKHTYREKLCISFLWQPTPQDHLSSATPPSSLTMGSFAGGLSNACADTLQPVSKAMHSAALESDLLTLTTLKASMRS